MGGEQSAETRQYIGKVTSPLDEKLKSVKWGEFKIGDLFDIKGNPQLNKDSFKFNDDSKFPYFTRTEFNNGILGYVDYLDDEHKINGGCLAVGMIAMKFFYMKHDFYAGQFTKRAIPKKSINLTERVASFFISTLNKHQKKFQNVLVGAFENEFKKTKIDLPVDEKNQPDYAFMEGFVAELEAEHIAELEAYLKASGLKDYTLTPEEEKVLEAFEQGKVKWGEFKIGDLFNKINTNKLKFKADELPKEPTEKNSLACLTSSFKNQGLNYFAPKNDATILKNVISIPSNSDVYRAYFQSQEFTVLSDAYAIKWVYSEKISPNQQLFTVACINKVTDLPIYSYKNKLGGWNVVKNKHIQIPLRNNKPDYSTMGTLISAIQKLVIKDVVLYADKKIAVKKQITQASA